MSRRDERDLSAREFVARREKIMGEWKTKHPEGITAGNLREAQVFFKKREKELKEGS